MVPTLSQFLVLFAFLTLSTQKKLNSHEVRNILEHLKTHASNLHPDESARSVFKVDNLNLYVPDNKVPKSRLYQKSLQKEGERRLRKVDPLKQLLNAIETELVKDSLRCPGRRCGWKCPQGRCGTRCCGRSGDRLEEYEEGDNLLRCKYGRCGSGCCGRSGDGPEEYEEGDVILRCKYGRCGSGCCGRSGDKSEEYEEGDVILRCKYGRCGSGCCGRSGNRPEKYEEGDVILRCKYGRCGSGCCARSGDRNNDDRDGGVLRCRNGRCGRDEVRDDNDEDDDGDILRCRYGRCGGGCCGRSGNRADDDKQGSKGKATSLASRLGSLGKKFKIDDDLEAVVVDLSGLDGVIGDKLTRLLSNDRNNHNQKQQEIDVDYVFGESKSSRGNVNDLNAVVVDLDDSDDNLVSNLVNEVLLKTKAQSEEPVRPNELVEYYFRLKDSLVGNALNFVKNTRGNKDVTHLTPSQKYQLQKLRAEVQFLGRRTNDKDVERAVADIVLGPGDKAQVLPHDEGNNNIYVPRWVHRAVRTARAAEPKGKRLLPLTAKQRLKLSQKPSRRAAGQLQEYGVPFEVQIQGLGQLQP